MEPEEADKDCKDIARILFSSNQNCLEALAIRHFFTNHYHKRVPPGISAPDHFADYKFDPRHFSAYLQSNSNMTPVDREDDDIFITGEYAPGATI
jgi:hypothetical protein